MAQKETPKTLIVVGGTGFVGTIMCREGILNGFNVISISRGGQKPHWLNDHQWANEVSWCKGDAFKPNSIEPYFTKKDYSVYGVISCVGGFHYSQKVMEQKCGDCNVNICKLSKKYGVKRFLFVSRDKTNLTDWWYPFPHIIPGYYKGKVKTEQFVSQCYDDGNGVCLLSGFVCGQRHLCGLKYIPIPLDLFCGCVRHICPTVNVDVLCKAALRFIKSERPSKSVLILNNDIATFYSES